MERRQSPGEQASSQAKEQVNVLHPEGTKSQRSDMIRAMRTEQQNAASTLTSSEHVFAHLAIPQKSALNALRGLRGDSTIPEDSTIDERREETSSQRSSRSREASSEESFSGTETSSERSFRSGEESEGSDSSQENTPDFIRRRQGDEVSEIFPQEAINQFEQETPKILHTRYYVQCLYEEDVISSVIDRVMHHPKIIHDLMDMLGHDIPESHPSFSDPTLYRKVVQTARAFQFASRYRENLKQLLDDPSPYLDSKSTEIHERIAYKTMKKVYNIRKRISDNPDRFIFAGTKDREEHPRKQETRIKAGLVSPLNEWTDTVQTEVQQILQTAIRLEQPPNVWQLPPEKFPQIRFVLDLSSLKPPLLYQGKPVKSLESMYYNSAIRVEEELYGIPMVAFKNKQFVISKITTNDDGRDNVHYIQQKYELEQDIGQIVREKVSPFLSGKQIEKDTTDVEESTARQDFWQEEDNDWRRSKKERKKYSMDIHPMTADYTLSIVADLVEHGKDNITILDAPGGNGDLAERIIKDIQARYQEGPKPQITYLLLNGNKKDIGIAEKRFRTLTNESEWITVSTFHKDLSPYIRGDVSAGAEALKRDIGLPQEGADIIISCGGMLNVQISNKADEARKYNSLYAKVAHQREGSVVVTGYSSALVNSKDHTENGMDVINLYDPYSEGQMHVVRRQVEQTSPSIETPSTE